MTHAATRTRWFGVGMLLLGLGLAANTILGPQYLTYQPAILLHLGLFVLSGALLVSAWSLIDVTWLPVRSRGWAVLLFFYAAFVLSRWGGALTAMGGGGAVPAVATDVTMYWSIFLLDLGIVAPVAVVTGIGLLLRLEWATKALYGVVGWFTLVPPSVAAMAIVKILRDDPNEPLGGAVVLIVVAIVFGAVAVWLYRPLSQRATGDTVVSAELGRRPQQARS